MNIQQKFLVSAACALAWPFAARAQITISASDMFNQAGQYYRAYGNTPQTSVDVTSMLGAAGSDAQAWSFTSGPQDVIYRFDYLAATNVAQSSDFPLATLAEQKKDEGSGTSDAWLFFDQDAAKGRVVYGFYDPGFGSFELLGMKFKMEPPAGKFQIPLRDFPNTIRFGDEWSSTTVYTNLLTLDDGGVGGEEEDPVGGIELLQETTYTSSAKVDAFGIASSPGIGFGECLRINELVQYDLAVDWGSGFEHFGTAFIRNYYWVRPGRGIVAQVTSDQNDTPPPDNFPTAAVVLRMFETNHPDAGPQPPEGIQGLTITLGTNNALLTWTALSGMTSYRVEYTSDPGQPASWQMLKAPTAGTFLVDDTARSPDAPVRYYRVVGLR